MALSIQGLSKRYGNGVQALDDVALEIPAGMFGLLGPNGAGKSTLMRILATLQQPDAGRVQLGDIDALANKQRVRQVLGYLPQEFGLYPKVTAEAMLSHFAMLKGIADKKARKETVVALLAQTNLFDARHRPLGSFSGGMKQRFGIAQALLGKPALIIVDEPTAGLDPEERMRFLNLLSDIGENIVVILSTHIVDDVSDLCSNMAIIDRGRVRRTGKPQQLMSELDGKIWKRLIDKKELPGLREQYNILSSHLLAGRVQVRVHADTQPDPSFEPIQPTLEDVYFTALGRGDIAGSPS